MSFRAKTILGVALIEGLLLFILIVSSLTLLRSSNEDELFKRAYTTAHLFASTAENAVLATDVATLHSEVQQVLVNPGVLYARVLGPDGTVLAQGGDAALLRRPFVPDKIATDVPDDHVIDAFADISVANQRYGRVEVGLSTAAIQKALAAARRQTIAIAAIEMGLVALFSFALGTYLTRGLGALRVAAQRVAEGELGYQVPITGTDELAQTVAAFNDMSRELKRLDDERAQAEEALNTLNADLERRVAFRTEQLAAVNQELEQQALHDPLTKLANRTLFYDRLEQAVLTGKREDRRLALVMIDLDGFKAINDTRGHHTGDLMLQEVADRLRHTLRQSDTVARLGGDEFALLLPTIRDADTALATVRKVHAALTRPMRLDNGEIAVGASLGVALFPQDGDDGEALMRRADTAMYDAKRNRRGITLYGSELDHATAQRDVMESELRVAIATGALVLHFQPKIDLAGGDVLGMEALLRWPHPRYGLLYPNDFLPLAAHAELTKPLTVWVLQAALAQCRAWRNDGVAAPVAVNVDIDSLLDADFPGLVMRALAKAELEPDSLELEVSEKAIMTDPPRAIANVRALSDVGVHIVIDDFGTGYSSLAYLRKLRVANIKIDGSFIRDMDQDDDHGVIVRSIIGLGHNLGFNVVAECVEKPETFQRLRELGCDAAQGYSVSRPMPADKLDAWLKQRKGETKT